MYYGTNSENFRVLAKIVTILYLLSKPNNDNNIDTGRVLFADKSGKNNLRENL